MEVGGALCAFGFLFLLYERVETRLTEREVVRESHVARICDGGVCYRLTNPFRATGKYELCIVDMHRGWMNVFH